MPSLFPHDTQQSESESCLFLKAQEELRIALIVKLVHSRGTAIMKDLMAKVQWNKILAIRDAKKAKTAKNVVREGGLVH